MLLDGGVAGRDDRIMLEDQLEDVAHDRQQLACLVDHARARPGIAEQLADSVEVVLMAGDGREPHDFRAETQRMLDRVRVESPDLVIERDAAVR